MLSYSICELVCKCACLGWCLPNKNNVNYVFGSGGSTELWTYSCDGFLLSSGGVSAGFRTALSTPCVRTHLETRKRTRKRLRSLYVYINYKKHTLAQDQIILAFKYDLLFTCAFWYKACGLHSSHIVALLKAAHALRLEVSLLQLQVSRQLCADGSWAYHTFSLLPIKHVTRENRENHQKAVKKPFVHQKFETRSWAVWPCFKWSNGSPG